MSEFKVKKHKYYLDILNEMYAKKNSDYGDAFSESLNEFGTTAALVRMSDKFNRLKKLMDNEDKMLVKEESIVDTLLDLANYAVMTAMWVESVNTDKEQKEKDGDLDIIGMFTTTRLLSDSEWKCEYDRLAETIELHRSDGLVDTITRQKSPYESKIWDFLANEWVLIE